MQFDPGLQTGDILTFKALREKFECGNTGGILPSKKNKTIVIISNHTKGIYGGQEGDQELTRNNKSLLEAESKGYKVYFFEVEKAYEYIYRGIVKVVGEP